MDTHLRSNTGGRKVYIGCDRSRKCKSRVDDGNRVRKSSSLTNECPFKIILRYIQPNWTLDVINDRHNHLPTASSAHLIHHHTELAGKSEHFELQIRHGQKSQDTPGIECRKMGRHQFKLCFLHFLISGIGPLTMPPKTTLLLQYSTHTVHAWR
jgi:hypothetical protein